MTADFQNSIHFLVPTRGRPDSCRDLYDQWTKYESGYSTIQFIVDSDDPEIDNYQKLIDDDLPFTFNTQHRFIGPIINDAASRIYESPLGPPKAIGFLGDDHRPRTKDFDRIMFETFDELGGSGIVYGNDLLMGERMPTALAVTSDFLGAVGHFVPRTLKHLCFDVYWLRIGQITHRIKYLDEVVIEHMHPAAGKAEQDEGYDRVNSETMVGEDGKAWRDYLVDQLWDDAKAIQAIL